MSAYDKDTNKLTLKMVFYGPALKCVYQYMDQEYKLNSDHQLSEQDFVGGILGAS